MSHNAEAEVRPREIFRLVRRVSDLPLADIRSPLTD